MNTDSLRDKGYRRVNKGPGGEAWVRLRVTPKWIVGQCVIVTPGMAYQIGAAACLAEAKLEALGSVAEAVKDSPPVVSGKLGRKLGKKFRNRINRAAEKIAKMKVMNRLRKAYIGVIQSPIVDMGIAAGARALSAFGVPAAATKVAIAQRRAAQVDRLQKGGWAGMVQRATAPGHQRGDLLREIAQRNIQASKKALPAGLPGAALRSLAGRVTSGYDPGHMRELYALGCEA